MADQEYTRPHPDPALAKKLEELQRQFEADSEFPDVVAAWEAIGHILRAGPSSFPPWVENYLAAAAEKIGRLWLGIHPENGQPINEILSIIGELRGVRGDRGRHPDVRTNHVLAALGFAQKGRTTFHHHDRLVRYDGYLRRYDDPTLEEDKRLKREVQQEVLKMMVKNEGGSVHTARRRLSKARCARLGNHPQTSRNPGLMPVFLDVCPCGCTAGNPRVTAVVKFAEFLGL